jgi:hypothetical protein
MGLGRPSVRRARSFSSSCLRHVTPPRPAPACHPPILPMATFRRPRATEASRIARGEKSELSERLADERRRTAQLEAHYRQEIAALETAKSHLREAADRPWRCCRPPSPSGRSRRDGARGKQRHRGRPAAQPALRGHPAPARAGPERRLVGHALPAGTSAPSPRATMPPSVPSLLVVTRPLLLTPETATRARARRRCPGRRRVVLTGTVW